MTIALRVTSTRWIAYALTAVVGVIVAAYLWYCFFDWPLADDLLIVDWYRKFVVGRADPAGILFLRHGPHPLAAEAAVALGLMSIFGVTFTPLVILNYVLLLSAALLLAAVIAPDLRSAWARSAVWPVLLLLYFEPTQINHILWPFEFGWMAITFLLTLNACLVERYRTPAVAMPGIAIAYFCSAQGLLLLPAAAVQTLLLPGLRRRWLWITAELGVFGMIAVLRPEDSLGGLDLRATVPYYVQLLGSIFGFRQPVLVLGLGLIELATATTLALLAARAPLLRADRIAASLVAYGLMATASFAFARYYYGLGWALEHFHAAPLAMPFVAGLAIVALRTADSANISHLQRGAAVAALCLLVASFATAIPYALSRGPENRNERAVAMAMTCGEHVHSAYVMEALNVDTAHMLDVLPVLEPLCGQPVPRAIAGLFELPPFYKTLAATDEAFRAPLERLWLVYALHFDLQRAFPLRREGTPEALLRFMRVSARTGPIYDTKGLGAYQAFFATVTIPDRPP